MSSSSTPSTLQAWEDGSLQSKQRDREESHVHLHEVSGSADSFLELEQWLDQEIDSLDHNMTLPPHLLSAEAAAAINLVDSKTSLPSLTDEIHQTTDSERDTHPEGHPVSPSLLDTQLLERVPALEYVSEEPSLAHRLAKQLSATPLPHTLDSSSSESIPCLEDSSGGSTVRVKGKAPSMRHTLSTDEECAEVKQVIHFGPDFSGEVAETCQEIPTLAVQLRQAVKGTDPDIESAPNWQALAAMGMSSPLTPPPRQAEEVLFSGSFEDLAQVSAKSAFHSFRPGPSVKPTELPKDSPDEVNLAELSSWSTLEASSSPRDSAQDLSPPPKPVMIPIVASKPRLHTTVQMDFDPAHPDNQTAPTVPFDDSQEKEQHLDFPQEVSTDPSETLRYHEKVMNPRPLLLSTKSLLLPQLHPLGA